MYSTVTSNQVAILAASELFVGLSYVEASLVELLAQTTPIKKDAFVFKAGARAEHLYVVSKGLFSLEISCRNSTHVIDIVGPYGTVGWRSLLSLPYYVVSAKALMDSELIALPAHHIQALLDQSPPLSTVVYRNLAEITLHRWESMIANQPEKRFTVAHFAQCPLWKGRKFAWRAHRNIIQAHCIRKTVCSSEEGAGCPLAGLNPNSWHMLTPRFYRGMDNSRARI